MSVVLDSERVADQTTKPPGGEVQPARKHEDQLVSTADYRASLMEALAELESAVVAFQDSRRSSKDKTALIEYFGGLQKCVELSNRVCSFDTRSKKMQTSASQLASFQRISPPRYRNNHAFGFKKCKNVQPSLNQVKQSSQLGLLINSPNLIISK